VIGDAVTLGAGTRVDAGAVVGDGCVLGPGCHLYPRAVLYAGVQLGARVVVHAGAVLGSAGFGYVRDTQTGEYLQFPQQGSLVIEDDVEIGANSTIDRGALEETRIGRGVKIDNLVHVGHNVRIARNVVIAAQTGISGSSSIGAGAVVAGQVGIADHVAIGEGVILGAQCGVPSNKQIRGPGVLFWGTPARPITQYLKELATLARLTRNRGGR
jgi:UDP-3-O-[3-hydroxymyristoyl] glucosamine N-acyltransferase